MTSSGSGQGSHGEWLRQLQADSPVPAFREKKTGCMLQWKTNKDMVHFSSNFCPFGQFDQAVGRGRLGVLYTLKGNKLPILVKVMDLNRDDEVNKANFIAEVENEFTVLTLLKHANNIIHPFSSMEKREYKEKYNDDYTILLRYSYLLPKYDGVIETKLPSTVKMREVVKQILKGLQALEENNVVHFNLKPQNILRMGDDYRQIAISDFESAEIYENVEERQPTWDWKGTPPYMSPEALHIENRGVTRSKIGFKTDIWSVGCIIAEMAIGQFIDHDTLKGDDWQGKLRTAQTEIQSFVSFQKRKGPGMKIKCTKVCDALKPERLENLWLAMMKYNSVDRVNATSLLKQYYEE
jgi:serine/threonine protein kinase